MFAGKIVRSAVLFRRRPQILPGFRLIRDGALAVFVSEEVLLRIVQAARAASPDETIGSLGGRAFQDTQGEWVVVTGAVEAHRAERTGASVETTLLDEREAIVQLHRDCPTAEKLGWWHSHPCDHPNYSAVDLENQRLWSQSFSVGLLVCLEGASPTVHIFVGPKSRRIGPACRITPGEIQQPYGAVGTGGSAAAPGFPGSVRPEPSPLLGLRPATAAHRAAPRQTRHRRKPAPSCGTSGKWVDLIGRALLALAIVWGAHAISSAVRGVSEQQCGEAGHVRIPETKTK